MTQHERRLLSRALRYWTRDIPIPADLWDQLAGLGWDVPALEDQHRP